MNVAQAAAEIFKREGVEFLLAYPLNPLTESCAAAGIRPIIVRQERVGLHMADAISRMTSGEKVGVFACQAGPGVENAFGAVAQAYSEGVPLIFMPGASPRAQAWIEPNFNAALNFQHIVKHAETGQHAGDGRSGPAPGVHDGAQRPPGTGAHRSPRRYVEQELKGRNRLQADPPRAVGPESCRCGRRGREAHRCEATAAVCGPGIHYAKAWPELKAVAELLEIPVTTSLEGKSAFPETHALSLGSGGVAMPKGVFQHVQEADVIFGAGASFTATPFGIRFPTNSDKTFVHNTLDPMDINKNIHTDYPLVGDSKLTLEMLHAAVKERIKKPRGLTAAVNKRIREQNDPWMAEWTPRLTSESKPLSPYRVIWDLMQVADVANTIITHDAGSPRDELSPFWRSVTPLSYIGWASRPSWATASAWRWARSWHIPTSCVSTCGAMRRSA